MKKVILSLLFSGIGLYAMGQDAVINSPNDKMPIKQTVLPGPTQHRGSANDASSAFSGWYDAINESANTGAESYTVYNSTIFSDSSVKALYGNGSGGTALYNVSRQGMGEVFDPKAPVYESPLSLFNTYNVDSLAMFYLYNYVPEKDTITPLSKNPDGLVHDTLIFQFYTYGTGGIDTGAFTTSTPVEPQAHTRYSPSTNLGTGAAAPVYKVILGQQYQHPDTPVAIQIPVINSSGLPGIEVSYVPFADKKLGFNRDLFAYTVSYRPGFTWKFGDTIDEKSVPLPKHLHSHFKILTGQSAKDAITDYEMSLSIISSVRYNESATITNGWNDQYIPGTAWVGNPAAGVPAYNEVLYSAFHINSPNSAGINQSVGDPKGFILGNVYPNPANGTAKLDFALGNTGQVKITVYDMLGHEISVLADGEYAQGMHTVSFNTDNLKEGIYLYSINAGSFSKTLKFTVEHN